MNDPLWDMHPGDPDWSLTLAEEAQSLAAAIWAHHPERFVRKAREVHDALGRSLRAIGDEAT